MSRLLLNGEWFEQLAPTTMLESEYERIILQKGQLIFPDYYTVPFKTLVFDGDGGARADLALIEQQYREWWVVEVETGNHSLDGHVLPQVKILANATYSEEVATALTRQLRHLDPVKISLMMKGQAPRVLVIVNEQKPEWKLALKRYNALLSTVEIYRSAKNQYIFRIDGELPTPRIDVITECHVDPFIRTWLVIQSPAGLECVSGDKVTLSYKDMMTEWIRIDSESTVWLSPQGLSSLSPKQTYEILRTSEGSLVIRDKLR
ncbi:MAG: hypothetical protein JXA33_13310 [Anaerolineae bacterium]|nr:hypothetical protein [Anaerolineae bacterium]